MDLKNKFRHVLDFPKEGIDFIDITTVLQDAAAFRYAIDCMAGVLRGVDFDTVIGSESRGFILGAPVAYALGKGFVPVRKKGKLPYKTVSASYTLEYGSDEVEMHEDAIKPGQKVVIVDDLLATGGTVNSNIQLIQMLGGRIQTMAFLLELTKLGAREKFPGYDIFSVVKI